VVSEARGIGPAEAAIPICEDIHHGSRFELVPVFSISADFIARPLISSRRARSPPPALRSRYLPPDGIWSPPLHGCHLLLVCYPGLLVRTVLSFEYGK